MYHVRYNRRRKELVICRVEERDGKTAYVFESDDRTEEIVNAVMELMAKRVQLQNNKDKPYFGYRLPGMGTLLYIDDGYTFSIRPAARKR